jgi:hypothetical protein
MLNLIFGEIKMQLVVDVKDDFSNEVLNILENLKNIMIDKITVTDKLTEKLNKLDSYQNMSEKAQQETYQEIKHIKKIENLIKNKNIETQPIDKLWEQLNDLKQAIEEIENGNFGTSLGNNLYKKRVPNSLIPTWKSGGFRVIIYEKTEEKIILLSIYSKTQKENLKDSELIDILEKYNQN